MFDDDVHRNLSKQLVTVMMCLKCVCSRAFHQTELSDCEIWGGGSGYLLLGMGLLAEGFDRGYILDYTVENLASSWDHCS